jgi:hypothetical protein
VGALPIKTDDITPVSLPALVDRAAQPAGARTAAEVLEAREMAGFAYDMAKRQARIAKAKQAHDDVIAAAHRSQGHALEIEARAKHRLADEYDAAEPRTREDNLRRGPDVPKENVGKPTAADLGLTRPQIHAARQVRDAEKAEPGIVKRSIEEMLEAATSRRARTCARS